MDAFDRVKDEIDDLAENQLERFLIIDLLGLDNLIEAEFEIIRTW